MKDTLILIDVDNTTVSMQNHHGREFDVGEVIAKAGGWERVSDAVAYGDFDRIRDVIGRHLDRHGVDCRHVPRSNGTSDKDLVDLRLSLDLSEIAREWPRIHRVILVAGDVDYVPAVCKAQQAGKVVEVFAVEGALSYELKDVAAGNVHMLAGGSLLRHRR